MELVIDTFITLQLIIKSMVGALVAQ
jgi:hypothetical protein